MKPKFWKLSQSPDYFSFEELSSSIENKLVYVHSKTKAKGGSSETQGDKFIGANVGDYFYLTHGNTGIYLLGQLTGSANIFSSMGKGWVDRPFRVIRTAKPNSRYIGAKKWWAPNENSTFTSVKGSELAMFEEHILQPYFNIQLSDYGVKAI
ncbi:hypothetical protein [Psychromonas aquatilis]|uniref:Uncharacterized protein n=1 Tax=Psychromonas aquatilis TaxID=2005072 RepID=A0ABU9GSS5_9GAMM